MDVGRNSLGVSDKLDESLASLDKSKPNDFLEGDSLERENLRQMDYVDEVAAEKFKKK
jgi:hypothetical protein